MDEVEKVTTAADIPNAGDVSDAGGNSGDLGTSPPTLERSSNSHPHDSEYDTASDLEGGDDYDDEEESLSDDDEDEDSLSDDDDDLDREDEAVELEEGKQQGLVSQEKIDIEEKKKVDEDRSNPQYIPKRGTFYEHDDRTVDGEAEGADGAAAGSNELIEGAAGGDGVKSKQSPTNSQASKTMKKWQPASGVDRWTHDRFNPDEQAPKTRSEIVSSYGYDIRTEDAPPRARRRRRYGRGPSKYNRNWEDETAYLKTSNKERKLPRASDFPALDERPPTKPQRTPVRRTREEKENRRERRQSGGAVGGDRNAGPSSRLSNQHERREFSDAKANRNKGGYGRQSGPSGRQQPMEFKQKQRAQQQQQQQQHQSAPQQQQTQQQQQQQQHNNYSNSRNDGHHHYERSANRAQSTQNGLVNEHQPKSTNKVSQMQPVRQMQVQQQQQQQQQHDSYNNSSNSNNNNKYSEHNYQQMPTASAQQQAVPMRPTSLIPKVTPPTNLSQRLQQVQNRNDPSHVGSVQMHALATQNQIMGQQQQQQQQQHAANMMMPQQQPPPPPSQQQQQQPQQMPPQEQRGPPKRYSSIRRSQHEAQHLAEQHQLQQMHLQQQQQQQQPQPQMLLPDQQHLLQANLLQMYHQENALQAQMQAMQVSQGGPQVSQPKQPTYAAVPPSAQPPPQAYGPATSNPAAHPAYYVTQEAFAATAAATAQASNIPQNYATSTPNFMAQPNAVTGAATLAYQGGPAPPPPQQAVSVASATAYGPPTTAVAPAGPGTAPPPTQPPSSNPNYPNFQNFNTVGGTTYFVPPVQATTRPVVLPQRRPTNAIPILPPSEKNKQRIMDAKEESKASSSQQSSAIDSAENIDHILDNMFVQRPAFQPQQAIMAQPRKSATPPTAEINEPSKVNVNVVSTEEVVMGATPGVDKPSSGSIEVTVIESNINNAVAAQE